VSGTTLPSRRMARSGLGALTRTVNSGITLPSYRRSYPAPLLHPDQIIAIATGREHVLVLASNGDIWAWGDTQTAQATNECFPPTIRSPILAGHFHETIGIAAGNAPCFAIIADGSILGWRSYDSFLLGNPFTPQPVYARPVADFLLVEDRDHDGIATSQELQAGTDPGTYSTLGDGLSNTWKLFFGLSITDPTLAQKDLTGKGMTVLRDYQLGTDPTKRSTVNDGIPDGWKVQYGISPLYCGVDTADWIGKGITVAMDYQAGTDPNKVSTLDDGVPDAWKIAHRIDPLDPNALSHDDDNDGLTNQEEYAFHTDPTNSDTNGNGILDGNENLVIVTIVSDTTQHYFLDQAYVSIVAEAKSPQGVALPNIPVTISVTQGSGTLAISPLLNPAAASTLTVRTGGNGRATVYFMPTAAGTVSEATIAAPRHGTVSGSNHVRRKCSQSKSRR
jgi:Alpha-tubulin suppressor and related RCC1 domain-containing proteins